MAPMISTLSGHRIAFVITSTRGRQGASPSQYLGLFNATNNENSSDHVFAVELDTIQNMELGDINYNKMLGLILMDCDLIPLLRLLTMLIRMTGLRTCRLLVATYATFGVGGTMSVWQHKVHVTLAPINVNGEAQDLDLSQLPKLPRIGPKKKSTVLTVGTLGYLAPEHTRTGKATTSTNVFAFGAFLQEVACGRRPIEPNTDNGYPILVDWVFSCLNQGKILEAADPNLVIEYVEEEMNLVLRLGLMCSHSDPNARPSMQQVVQYLEADAALPDLSKLGICGPKFSAPRSHFVLILASKLA
ncbi:Serine-threonine/tyrosine-protein kinase, catalytic domain [Dillenia turbinata]|uniref:Serine-threonine/tyrosine-protein kinase, catalytic domain n=1 Tax=Dillenia turbinata TaxID=194707 RepID=A0AAN8W7W5_9MAGN